MDPKYQRLYYQFLSGDMMTTSEALERIEYYDEGVRAHLCHEDALDYSIHRMNGMSSSQAYQAIINDIMRQV